MNTRVRSILAAVAALSASIGCRDENRLLPDLPCFAAEQLRVQPVIFGALTQDASEPGGWSGMEVHFGVDAAGRLTAAIRESGIEPATTRPVDLVSYDARHDSISFTYAAPGHTKFTRTFRPSCDRLVGYATYYRAESDTSGIVVDDTLPRVASKKS